MIRTKISVFLFLLYNLLSVHLASQKPAQYSIADLEEKIDSINRLVTGHNTEIRKLQLKIDTLTSLNLASVKASATDFINFAQTQGLRTYTTGNNVEIRKAPNYSSDILETLGKNQTILVLQVDENYFFVQTDALKGWVHQIWIKKNDEIKLLKHATLYGNLNMENNKTVSKSQVVKRTKSVSRSNCESTQCIGITQKNRRCANSTTNCNKRCHLHD